MAGTQEDTSYDLTVCRLGTDNILGRFLTLSADETATLITTHVAQNRRESIQPGFVGGTIRAELVRYSASPLLKSSINTEVSYTHDLGGSVETGTCVVRSTGLRTSANSVQNETFEAVVSGTPTLSA